MKRSQKERIGNLAMMIPALGFLGVFFVYPLSFVFYWSLRNYYPVRHRNDFVFLDNFIKVFGSRDFLHALTNNFVFVGSVVAVTFVLGLGMALLVNRRFRGSKIFSLVLVLPMLYIPASSAVLWSLVYNRDFGVLNLILSFLGFGRRMWLASPDLALWAVMLTDIWAWTPWTFLILYAGLQNLPREPVESAVIDGASSLQVLWYITLPMLRPVISIAIVLKALYSFRIFDYIWVMTKGGPGGASEVLSTYVYKTGFRQFKYGFASAMSVVMILISLGMVLVLVSLVRRAERG